MMHANSERKESGCRVETSGQGREESSQIEEGAMKILSELSSLMEPESMN